MQCSAFCTFPTRQRPVEELDPASAAAACLQEVLIVRIALAVSTQVRGAKGEPETRAPLWSEVAAVCSAADAW